MEALEEVDKGDAAQFLIERGTQTLSSISNMNKRP